MKNIFKAFIIMILSFALCIPLQIIVKASTFTNMESKKDVAVNKSWTVSFNSPLSSATVNTTNIKVVGENNNYIGIKVSSANNNKNIIVQSIGNYEYNKTYTLIVTENVKSYDGKPLPKEVRMDFTTKAKYKVVLDAGHGGNDPGAIGPTGLQEKAVALAVTLKVGALLTKNGVDTLYTRTSDITNMPDDEAQNLQVRCDISNNAKPDYFVSIHLNSFSTSAAYGIETHYFTGSVSGQKLAEAVQTELIKETGRFDRGLKTSANLYVLKNTDATAILVETSFISNPEEEKLLATEDYQQKLAKAISTGILKSLGISNIVV
ncbi:N-acetylmuramoyl-L-alanine amidase [Clostridium estertheticum]|uniref:N-acetylmuramoyl-L-alanine amidase n=1 Tax=Clostridium estertheticum TaxID=238834 RepID=UPI0013E8FFD8|nr:N-acetylmuramoyl-L-alanine amidase [Clostridium estertheticum]MBZ9687504.1 N-acetylmuramoyl-L-alanine amidase [Clostridium estertheticum]